MNEMKYSEQINITEKNGKKKTTNGGARLLQHEGILTSLSFTNTVCASASVISLMPYERFGYDRRIKEISL